MGQNNLDEISRILREERERQNLSIQEVAAATKINAKVIEALEIGDLGQLPPKAFLRGFVQSYARFLKLDSRMVLDVFHRDLGQTKYQPSRDSKGTGESPLAPASGEQRAMDAANQSSGQLTRFLWTAVIVVLIFVIYGVSNLIEKYQKETITTGTVEAVGDQVSRLENPTSLPTPASGAQGASISPSPSPASTPEPKLKYNLEIEALDTVEVTSKVDAEAPVKFKLGPEEKRVLRADKQISLELSDGGAVMLNLNGADKGVPGDLGRPLKLRFP